MQLPSELQKVISEGRKDPVVFADRLLGIPLHQGQIRYLRRAAQRKDRKFILVPANRWGKSTMIAVLHLWTLFYKFGLAEGNREAWLKTEYRTANIAPHSSLTEPVFKYMDQIMTSRFPIPQRDGSVLTNECLIEWFYLKDRTLHSFPYKQFFAFNSYIEHRSLGGDSGDSLQGKPYGLITYDEGGRSGHLEDELSANILPRLFDWSGQFHLVSTADSTSPSILYHYQLYQDGLIGQNQTYTQEGSLKDNTFFSPSQIEEQYSLLKDDPMGPQILEGKFIFGGDTVFDAQTILNAQDETLNDGLRAEENHTYTIGIDTAIGSDEMVYTVLDTTQKPFKLVRQIACKGNSKSPQMHLNDLIDLVEAYANPTKGNIKLMLETWNGESVRFYHDLPYWIQVRTKCYGTWQPEIRQSENKNKPKKATNDVKKADLLLSCKKLLSAGELKIPKNNQKLIQQLSIYREDDHNIPTDRVISLCLSTWIATEGANFMGNSLDFMDW